MTFRGHQLWYLAPSTIHGQGTFARVKIPRGTVVDKGITFTFGGIPNITSFGSMINHSWHPNVRLHLIDGEYYLVAITTIPAGHEILMSYQETPWFISKPNPQWR